MARYLSERILSAILTLFFITAFLYILLSLVHGSALDVLRAGEVDMSPADYEALRRSLGLDRPPWIRYLLWLKDVLSGNLGVSYRYSMPVSEIIAQRIGPSLLLSLVGFTSALAWGLLFGVMAAYRPASVWDKLSSFFALVGSTTPRFIACVAGIYLFSYRLRLAPALGMHTTGNRSLGDLLIHLILPASIISFGTMGYLIKHIRGACLEVFSEDYMKTARAKGLSEPQVVICHGVRNALGTIITQITLEIPNIVGGSAITEKVFAWPGIGSLMIEAISSRDQPLIMGVALVISVVVLITSILLDIAYGFLDPRVTYQRRRIA